MTKEIETLVQPMGCFKRVALVLYQWNLKASLKIWVSDFSRLGDTGNFGPPFSHGHSGSARSKAWHRYSWVLQQLACFLCPLHSPQISRPRDERLVLHSVGWRAWRRPRSRAFLLLTVTRLAGAPFCTFSACTPSCLCVAFPVLCPTPFTPANILSSLFHGWSSVAKGFSGK